MEELKGNRIAVFGLITELASTQSLAVETKKVREEYQIYLVDDSVLFALNLFEKLSLSNLHYRQ